MAQILIRTSPKDMHPGDRFVWPPSGDVWQVVIVYPGGWISAGKVGDAQVARDFTGPYLYRIARGPADLRLPA